jgi:anaerobic ribonucleoside-triphosphate reductase
MVKKESALVYFPGGDNLYLHTLKRILTYIQEVDPDERQLEKWFTTNMGGSTQLYRRCIRLIENLELVEKSRNRYLLKVGGREFLETQDSNLIFKELDKRYAGVGDVLAILTEEPLTIDEIILILKEKTGIGWKTK